MRMLEVHTAPIWQEGNGTRTVGITERREHGPVVGWVNVAKIILLGEIRWLILTKDA
jgi:hypothetical protein